MKRSLSGFKNKLLSRAVISYASLMKSKAKHLSFMVAKDYDLRQKLESDLIDILHQPFWISKDAAIAYLDMLEGDEFGQKYFLKKALKGRKDSQDYFLRRELIDFLVDVKNKHPKLASSLATEANNLMELHSLHVAGYFIDRTDPAAVSQVSFLLREASEEELEEFAKTFDLSFAMSPPEDFQYSIQSFITLALLGAKGSETSYSHLAFIQRTLAHDHRIGQSTLLEVCPGHHVSLGRFASVIPLELQELLGVEPQKLMDKEAIDLVPHLRSFQHCTAIKIAQRVFEGPAPFLRDPSANAPEYFNAIYRSLDRYYDMTHAKIWTEALCGMENFDNTIFDHFTSIQIREILYQAGDNITDPDVFDQLRQKLGVSVNELLKDCFSEEQMNVAYKVRTLVYDIAVRTQDHPTMLKIWTEAKAQERWNAVEKYKRYDLCAIPLALGNKFDQPHLSDYMSMMAEGIESGSYTPSTQDFVNMLRVTQMPLDKMVSFLDQIKGHPDIHIINHVCLDEILPRGYSEEDLKSVNALDIQNNHDLFSIMLSHIPSAMVPLISKSMQMNGVSTKHKLGAGHFRDTAKNARAILDDALYPEETALFWEQLERDLSPSEVKYIKDHYQLSALEFNHD